MAKNHLSQNLDSVTRSAIFGAPKIAKNGVTEFGESLYFPQQFMTNSSPNSSPNSSLNSSPSLSPNFIWDYLRPPRQRLSFKGSPQPDFLWFHIHVTILIQFVYHVHIALLVKASSGVLTSTKSGPK